MTFLIFLCVLFGILCIIRETSEGKFIVMSENGRRLGGPYDSREEAMKRLQQVEMFKHMKSKGKKPRGK